MFSGLAHTLAGEHVHVHLPGGSFYYTRREPFGVSALASAPGIIRFRWPCGNPRQPWPAATAWCSSPPRSRPLPPLAPWQLAEIYAEAGLPAGLFSVVQGGRRHRPSSNTQTLRRCRFTGGVAGGQAVAEAAGRLIRPVTLELGGKSPLIIFADADLDEAVRGAVLANYLCQGQVCSNAARVFVERRILDDFVDRLLRRGRGPSTSTPSGSWATSASAEAEGAKRLFGGDRVEVPAPGDGHFLAPWLRAGQLLRRDAAPSAKRSSARCSPLLEFDTERLRRSACRAGVFTRDLARAHRVIGELQAGSLYINTYNSYPPGVPFGGYKMSGFGRENCAESLRSYSQVKSVYVECAGIQLPTVP
uniref:Aldedh domain-containing protein n=1 Tax=Macrostomum lignano TaxID=282301 RepID=A0A1I8FFT5_9PLAT